MRKEKFCLMIDWIGGAVVQISLNLLFIGRFMLSSKEMQEGKIFLLKLPDKDMVGIIQIKIHRWESKPRSQSEQSYNRIKLLGMPFGVGNSSNFRRSSYRCFNNKIFLFYSYFYRLVVLRFYYILFYYYNIINGYFFPINNTLSEFLINISQNCIHISWLLLLYFDI